LEHRKFFCPTEGEGGSRGLGFKILIFKNCQKTRFANIVVSHCDKDNLSVIEKSAGGGRPRKSVQHIFLFCETPYITVKGRLALLCSRMLDKFYAEELKIHRSNKMSK
jgi:hypothetical protein